MMTIYNQDINEYSNDIYIYIYKQKAYMKGNCIFI